MGAIRVQLCGGGEDVFVDEQVGGDGAGVRDPGTTVFDFRYQVAGDRSLAVTVSQLFHDHRYSPDFHPVGSVEVASYRPSEWLTVSKA